MARKITIYSLFIVVCLFGAGAGAEDQPQKKVMKFIAVMNLTCGEGIKKEACNALTDMAIEELVKIGKATGKFTVIDRANRDKILSEQGFQQTGCVEESCTVDAGRLLGVGKLIVGSISKVGETYIVTLQIINVQSAAVDTAESEKCKCDIDGLIDTVRNVARKLMGEQPAQPPPPQRPAQPVVETPPKPEEIKFIAATPEQQKLCPEGMVYVPAGWFMMGCNAAKDSQCIKQKDENPFHPVYLDAYCIDQYEYPNRKGEKPKNKVNWSNAQSSCSSQGKRLPTEAEWEKAARGTDGRTYPWGEGLDKSKANYGEMFGGADPSGSREVNKSPYGVYDMAGNLWEWATDWYGENYYSGSPLRNPTGPASGSSRVLRGGSWSRNPSYLRASDRDSGTPGLWDSNVGFRCSRTP